MTNLNALQEIQYLKQVWATVLPSVPQPPDSNFISWSATYGVKAVETVIGEMVYRMARTTKPPSDAIPRIISSQLKSRKVRTQATAVQGSSFESLLTAVRQTELTDQNIARVYSMFIRGEVTAATKLDLSVFSGQMLQDTIFVQQASTTENPNLKLIASKCRMVVDSLEVRTGGGEGEALVRLHRLETALRDEMRKQSEQGGDDSRGNQ
jgi:hypothetical protein